MSHVEPAPPIQGCAASARTIALVAADAGTSDGEAMRRLRRVGHHYVAWVRLITLIPTAAVCLILAGTAASPGGARVSMAVLVGWSLAYAWTLTHRRHISVTIVDPVVLVAMAMSTGQIVPVSWLTSGKSWLLPFLAFACACYQYYAGWLLGTVAAGAVVTAAVIGTAMAVPPGGSFDSIHTAIWTVVLVGLARVFWTLVTRGGRRADQTLADTVRAQADQAVAREVRAEQLEHNRRLHDTAATTLLMVGLGQAGRNKALLRAQAERDVTALTVHDHRSSIPYEDLIEALLPTLDLVPLSVEFDRSRRIVLPTPVVRAFVGAAAEALNNVVRHTDQDSCSLIASGDTNHVTVEITDAGSGFDGSRVSTMARGLRDSIRGRMEAAGGHATVISVAGSGTRVVLEWPDAHH